MILEDVADRTIPRGRLPDPIPLPALQVPGQRVQQGLGAPGRSAVEVILLALIAALSQHCHNVIPRCAKTRLQCVTYYF